MNVEIRTEARNSFSGNMCFEFSVLCLCSAAAKAKSNVQTKVLYRLGCRFPVDFLKIPYPRVSFSFWKSQTFCKSLETFWFVELFLEILKIQRLVWIFPWIFGCFERVS